VEESGRTVLYEGRFLHTYCIGDDPTLMVRPANLGILGTEEYIPLLETVEALGYPLWEDDTDGTIYITPSAKAFAIPEDVNVPVLMYHAVSDNMWGIQELFVSPKEMEKQLAYLVDNGYDPIWFEDLAHVEDYDKPVILTFDDGYEAAQRLNIGGKTDPAKGMAGSVMFKTGNAGTIKIWWVSGGDGRELGLYDASGEILEKTAVGSVKDSLYISEIAIPAAGTYYLGVPDGSNYIFKIEVTETAGGAAAPERGDWSAVAAPVITEAIDDGEGQIKVTVSASIGFDGGDELLVTMYDAEGNEIATRRSIAEKQEHVLLFEPENSGN
jgi:hypothetical protein